MTRAHTESSTLFGVALCAVLCACGGPEKAENPPSKPSPAAVEQQRELQYNRRCFSRSNEHAQSVKSGRYIPPGLYIHRWPATDMTVKTGQTIKETRVASSLAKGKIQRAMIIARGGAGKTSLAKALDVELCDSRRTFLVHLQWDVATNTTATGNPILHAIGASLGAPPSAELKTWLSARAAKASLPWLVLLDAFDEVSLSDRAKVAAWVNELQTALPAMSSVVFSRPPVFDETFGLTGIQAIAEIPPLSCEVVDRGIMAGTGGTAAGKKFLTFLQKFRLNVQVRRGTSCYYPHMSTWRDLGALRHIARMAELPAMAKRLATHGIQSRTGMYEAYLITLLQDDVQGTTMGPHDTLTIVDSLIKKVAKPGTRGLAVRLTDCMAVAPGNGPERKANCETLLQSSLFRRTSSKGWWRLANQTLTDLFLARKIHSELPPAGGDGCSVLQRRTHLFESSEIGGFLLGMPRGQECLAQVAGVICTHSRMRDQQLAEIARGLPPGKAGHKRLVAALARAKQDSRTPKCALDALQSLEQSLRPATGTVSGLAN